MLFFRALIAAALLTALPVHAQDASRAEAAAMAAKIARIREAAEHPRPPNAPPLRTAFTDREMNTYLAVEGPSFLPPGIARPQFTAQSGGRVVVVVLVVEGVEEDCILLPEDRLLRRSAVWSAAV